MTKPTNYKRQDAFSLIEMTAVIIIIGLLAGVVMAGKNLIHQAKLRALMSDEAHYAAAVLAFKGKYNAMPGDMVNATNYWGPLACTGNTNVDPSATCTGTTNGDGDGHITGPEMIVAWQQLALAGLTPGKYVGVGINGNYWMLTTWANVELNLPATALSHVYPMIWYEGPVQQYMRDTNDGNGFYLSTIDAGHVMVFGTPLSIDQSNSGAFTNWPSMYSADAQTIDVKLDDGNPATGKIQALAWSIAMPTNTLTRSSCVSYSNAYVYSTFSYNLSYTTQDACALAFIGIF